jgi:hypothetical protein
LRVLTIIRPETLVRWHTEPDFAATGVGSRGRPRIDTDLTEDVYWA